MKYSFAFLFSLLLALACTTANAQSLRTDLEDAITKLETGTAQLEINDPRSRLSLNEAAAQFERLIIEYDHQTAGIYHALGNAYMLNGDLGHAVLSYRKGELIDPTHIQIQASLAHTRSIVPLRIEPNKAARIWNLLLSWRGVINRSSLWYAFIAFSLAGWAAWSAQILGLGSRKLRVVGMWLIVTSLIPLAMLGSEWARYRNSTDIVITSKHVNARSGPDHEIYDAAFVDGLQAGVEGIILESRDNWHRLQLADGSQCWVPETSVGKVNSES